MAKAIAWKSLKHRHGPATRVPTQIKQLLTAATPFERDEAYWELWEALVGCVEWVEASAPAVTLLLDSATKTSNPTRLFVLVADIIGSDQLRGWLTTPDAVLTADEKAVHAAAVDKKNVLLEALAAKDGEIRGAAAMALAMLPELATESLPVLLQLAKEDQDIIAKASAVLALGRLGAQHVGAASLIETAREPGHPGLVRGAAAMSWLRQGADRRFEHVRAEIEEWLAFQPDNGIELPWFRRPMWYRTLPFPDALARTLAALGRHRNQTGVDEVTDFAVDTSRKCGNGPVETQLAKVLLAFAAFPGEAVDRVALVEELSPEQKAMAKRIATTHLLPMGGHRLPASGACRRRWIGVDPPGPIDRYVEHKGILVPLWRAWRERKVTPDEFGSRLAYRQSLIEYTAKSYPPFMYVAQPAELEEELRALPSSEALFALVACIADDLAERFAAAVRGGTPVHVSLTMSGLLLLPLVRAGKPIEPRWDSLVAITKDSQSRELLAALPLERREVRFCNHLATGPGLAITAPVVEVVDLAPTRRVVVAINRRLDELGHDPILEARIRELRKKLEDLVLQSADPAV